MDCYMMRHGSPAFNLPTIITDSFNRANGNLGNADTGQQWLTNGAATDKWIVSENKARRATATTDYNHVAYIDCGKSDVIVSADITFTTSSSGSYLVARMSGVDVSNGSITVNFTTAGNIYLNRWIGGVNQLIGQASGLTIAYGSTHSLVLMCRGNVFTVYFDGVMKISTEDDNVLKANTRVGMLLRCSSAASDYFDNFSVKG